MLTSSNPTGSQQTSLPFPDKEAVAAKFDTLSDTDKSFLLLLMENPAQDESLLSGVEAFLDRASQAKFLHSLKLEKAGEWLGDAAPNRLQIRLSELSRAGQHPAYQAFRTGVVRSGGFERAYPKSKI